MTLRVAIVTDDPGWHGARLRRALTARGMNTRYASLTQCRLDITSGTLPVRVPGFETALPEAVFVRGVPGGTLEQVIVRLDVLHALRELGVPVYDDARAIERSVKEQGNDESSPAPSRPADTADLGDGRIRRCPRNHPARNGCRPSDRLQTVVRLPGKRAAQDRPRGRRAVRRYGCKGVWYLQRYVGAPDNGAHWQDWRV